jgi:hypothetical protein
MNAVEPRFYLQSVGSCAVSIGQSCRKRINASRTFSETILCMDALRAMLASTFYPSAKLTEFSLAPSSALCEMPPRSAALY